jgi:sodium-dependent dicarboxylate transporter 2/3/5
MTKQASNARPPDGDPESDAQAASASRPSDQLRLAPPRGRTWARLAGPLLGAAAYAALSSAGQDAVLCRTAGVAVWMAVWWIFEAVNIYATGLLPLVAFPLLGILPMKTIAPYYMKDVIFLFVGGFVLAHAVERWDLHRRVASRILSAFGESPTRLLAGFMAASWFLSMWILNTATATLLLPAVLAVSDRLEPRWRLKRDDRPPDPATDRGHTSDDASDDGSGRILGVALLLGVAYAASIGGTATLVGTMPNLILKDFYAEHFPAAPPLDFARWFAFAAPFSALLVGSTFLWLRWQLLRRLVPVPSAPKASAVPALEEHRRPWRTGERVLAWAFAATVLLWFSMRDLDIGGLVLPGWADALGLADYVRESTVAMLAVVLLFLWPAGSGAPAAVRGAGYRDAGIVVWADVQRVPIGVVFLFGGGFALAGGIDQSGLGAWLSQQLLGLGDWPVWTLVLGLCLFTTFFTELTSNTASTILLLSLLLGMVQSLGLPPLLVFLPVTLSASCAFMLPVATPPNTIVFGSERLRVSDMARSGLVVNAMAVFWLSLVVLIWGPRVFAW